MRHRPTPQLTAVIGQILLFELLELVEVAAGAEGRVHLVGVVEEAVVDGVLARVLAEGHQRLEAVPPQDLRRQVRAARLRRHARRFDGPLQNDDDFKLLFEQVRRRDVVQRRVGRDLVHHRRRPDEEDVAVVHVHGHLKFVLVVRHLLSFGRDPHLNELGSDAGADDVRFTHVPHAEKEAQLT